MNSERSWMYIRLKDGLLNPVYLQGIDEFIEFAKGHPECMDGIKIKCACNHRKCQNRAYHDENMVRYHLMKYGFVRYYYQWIHHGESSEPVFYAHGNQESVELPMPSAGPSSYNLYEQMVIDAGGPDFSPYYMEEAPNAAAQKLFDMLKAAKQEVWSGCESHSQLSAVARMLNFKAEHHLSERCFNDFCQFLKEVLPCDNVIPSNFYNTKKLVQGLGLPVEKIHCCRNGCMIYWGEDRELTTCKSCEFPRYKRREGSSFQNKKNIPYKKMYYFPLTARLQRLYASNATAKEMRWHAEHEYEEGVMRHCSDTLAWKHFDDVHPSFATESRNVRLGLCTDGFQPFGQSGQQYSSWPVIVTPYNLPPSMCMKEEYMFLTVIVPGPKNPKERLDVYLQPLIAELKQLWEIGVETYDAARKNNFQMRAALMWTISDFPAYSMLSGWSTAGRTACPYCKEDSDAFTLTRGGKQSWFDNHRKFLPLSHPFRRNKTAFRRNRTVTKMVLKTQTGDEVLKEIEDLKLKRVIETGAYENNSRIAKSTGWRKRSIFWDLPYWQSNLIRHNLDVMHIEKNVFENIFNTVMNVEGKTKDNAKSREDLKEFCRRPELEKNNATGKYPKACYTLDKQSKIVLCEWLRNLRFPDGYASNMSRCIDMRKLKLFGMKSHDCHVFMQRLLPIAFRELLPSSVWRPLTELSNFFRELTSTVIRVNDMLRLNDEIPLILCKLERIFPPSFFDSMEHLPVHLAYEAWIAGPVQYRWMYPFERYLRKLKNNVRNKAKVEGSICNAYLVEEASSFCAHYFEPHVKTRHHKVPRNVDVEEVTVECPGNLSIFTRPGRTLGKAKTRYLTEEEYSAAQIYILLNCPEVQPFINMYVDELRSANPQVDDRHVDERLEREFTVWFYRFAHDPSKDISNQFLKDLSKGPLRSYKSYSGCIVNGYKFHTTSHKLDSTTMNSGVCIKGTNYTTDENDYYGQLIEVLCLEYPGLPIKQTILFKCDWFDPTPKVGTRCHQQYKLVDVNHRRFFNKYEPFVFEIQATQVNYTTYPSLKRDKVDWWAVFKVKARSVVELPQEVSRTTTISCEAPFQQDEMEAPSIEINVFDAEQTLNDPSGVLIEIDDGAESEEEPPLESESNDDGDENDEFDEVESDSQ